MPEPELVYELVYRQPALRSKSQLERTLERLRRCGFHGLVRARWNGELRRIWLHPHQPGREALVGQAWPDVLSLDTSCEAFAAPDAVAPVRMALHLQRTKRQIAFRVFIVLSTLPLSLALILLLR